MSRAAVHDDDLWGMLLCSLRYSLSLDAPRHVRDWLWSYREYLTPEQRSQVAREVSEEARRCRLGTEGDHREWVRFAATYERGRP